MKNQAFTLIEVLVVVLIIGILAAIAVPQYQVAVGKSRLATIKDLTNSIAQAQELFYLSNGRYSESLENLDMSFPAGGTFNANKNVITYSWGYCSIEDRSNSGCLINFSNTWIYYVVYHKYVTSQYKIYIEGKTFCQTSKNTIGMKICKSDTGATSTAPGWPSENDTAYPTYLY